MKLTLLSISLILTSVASAAYPALSTVAERSGFTQTGRYAEVQALCPAFARAYPKAMRCERFGTTPEGRPMLALIASTSGALTPEAARRKGLPVLLVQGGIHAGEIDGKDAGFQALRQVLDGQAAPGALAKQLLVFVPVFNVDGHERFGPWMRPNQRGPEQMGWRTTAQNYNLNRDYAKADSPEMQAMLALVNRWDPLAVIDLHVTDGAQFEHDVSIQVEPAHTGSDAMRQAGRALQAAVIADLAVQGALPLPFYMSFVTADDPASGFADNVSTPRFSTGYFLLRNRFGMLVETHSWKDYATRVRITRNTIVSVLGQIAQHGRAWQATARAADAQMETSFALSYKASEAQHLIDFRGYAYTRTPSAVSGALMTRYDETKPEIWRVPLRDEIVAAMTVSVPAAGYLVPAAHARWVAQKLAQHGIEYRTIKAALLRLDAETFRADTVALEGTATVEGHARQTFLQGRWAAERRDVAAGALFVPIAQPKAKLVMALLEPEAPDSFAAWGRFATAFEPKEYMEAYVAEDVARAQMAADPALAAAFKQKLADEPAFAASPADRLAFFARRHPSWDERLNLYPVLRVGTTPP